MDAPSNRLPTGILPFQPPSNRLPTAFQLPSNGFPTASNGVCTNPPNNPPAVGSRLLGPWWALGGSPAARAHISANSTHINNRRTAMN
jgi:hypothetical protein